MPDVRLVSCNSAKRLLSVSYTHLDVYKRQQKKSDKDLSTIFESTTQFYDDTIFIYKID